MDKNYFQRLLWLLDTIHHAGHISFEEINNRWKAKSWDHENIPLRTFHNHRCAIERIFDINIECDKHTNEYYIADADGLYNNSLKVWLLNSVSLNHQIQENIVLKDRILFEDIPTDMQFVGTIVDAILHLHLLKIVYQAFTWNNPEDKIIEPYFLRLFKQRWYLFGRNIEHGQIRSYALDRIQSVYEQEDIFVYPTNLNTKDFFKNYYGIITNEDYKPLKTLLKVSSDQAPYIRNLPLHHSQIEIESKMEFSIFQLNLCHTYDFIKELLSLGKEIEVLEPDSLRQYIKDEIDSMKKLYDL